MSLLIYVPVMQEVVNATIDVLKSMQETLKTFKLEFTELDWGTARYKTTGKYMPDDGLDILRKFDAGIFGAVGAPGTRILCHLFGFWMATNLQKK